MAHNLQLKQNHLELLEIAQYALTTVKPNSVLGVDISKAIQNGKKLKNSVAVTTES